MHRYRMVVQSTGQESVRAQQVNVAGWLNLKKQGHLAFSICRYYTKKGFFWA